MNQKKRRNSIIVVLFLAMAIVGTGSFISNSKFGVLNPLSTGYGLYQVVFTEKEFIELQKYPKVIVAKPNASLSDYMGIEGFKEDNEFQSVSLSLHRFKNNDSAQYIMNSTNNYFSIWRWNE